MSAIIRARAAARQRHASPWQFRIVFPLTLLALAGCAAPQAPVVLAPDPANPETTVPGTAYRGVFSDYRSRRPSAQTDWRNTNDSVVPKKDAR